MQLILSDEAEADLRAIIRFSVERWGIEQAERYVQLLRDRLQDLTRHPRIGSPADSMSPGLRRFSYISHVAYYRVVRHEIRIVRILHKRMRESDHIA
ncbi:MAG: type II toxin-antitoxin system RelE/ParE family toxin [Parasphingopyxis sp.]|nr:type II toxin-antitoxin system RelE/ParE family toxin [Sphingomonadales bacterium]